MQTTDTRRIVLVEHHKEPADDRVSTHLARRGFALQRRYPAHGDALGVPDDSLAGTVIFGGAQNVDEMDKHPYLRDEVAWIRECHARRVPMLGICLGAQLIAHAFGGKVSRMADGRCEFGYYAVTPSAAGRAFLPRQLHFVQAHFCEFALPPGATLLAQGEGCMNQAFCLGEGTFAVQFHPEVTPSIFRRWQNSDWGFWGTPGAQTREQQDALSAEHDAAQHSWFVGFLDGLF